MLLFYVIANSILKSGNWHILPFWRVASGDAGCLRGHHFRIFILPGKSKRYAQHMSVEYTYTVHEDLCCFDKNLKTRGIKKNWRLQFSLLFIKTPIFE